jgi:putative tricarboxylic transport membrane protein
VRLTRDGFGGLACLAGSLVLLWTSREIPQPALVPIGPAFYPRIVLGVTAALSAAVVAADLWRRQPASPLPPTRVSYRLVLLTFVVFALYVFVLPLLGYRVSTLLFVAGLQATLDPPRRARDWAVLGTVAVVSMLLTYYVFERYLNVLLPRGRLTGF